MKTKIHFTKIIGYLSALIFLFLCGGFIYAIYPELNMGKEPDFPKIQAIPDESELLFFQTGNGLHVTTLSGKVNLWEPSEKFCDAAYSWSEKNVFFSIWGKECASNSENRNFYTVSLDGRIEMIKGVEPYAVGYEHEWSPDGTMVAFPNLLDYQTPIPTYIFLNEYGKPNSKQLTYLPNSSVYDLSWSPDGSYIAFVCSPFELKQSNVIYKVNTHDGSITQLPTGLEGKFSSPRWSQDGKWISFFYQENIDAPYSLWIMSTDTGETRLLFKPPNNEYISNSAWSSNSQQIAFASSHEGTCKKFVGQEFEFRYEWTACGYQIYVIDIDGKNMERITNIVSYSEPFRLFWVKVGGG